MKTIILVISLILLFSFTISAQTVYITKTDSKYHLSKCSYLSKSKISIDLKEAKEGGGVIDIAGSIKCEKKNEA